MPHASDFIAPHPTSDNYGSTKRMNNCVERGLDATASPARHAPFGAFKHEWPPR